MLKIVNREADKEKLLKLMVRISTHNAATNPRNRLTAQPRNLTSQIQGSDHVPTDTLNKLPNTIDPE